MKNFWITFPCLILFFILSLFVGSLGESLFIQIFSVLLISILVLPAYYRKFPRKWKAGRRLKTHFAFSFSIVLMLQLFSSFRLGVMKEKAFDHRFGHLSGPFRPVYAVWPFQYVIGKLYRLAPLELRVSFYQKEDSARVRRVFRDVDADFSRSLLCYEKDRATCYLAVMKSSAKNFPLGTHGTITLFEKGAELLKKEERLKPSFHKLHLKQSSELLSLVSLLSARPETEISQYVPGFPESTQHPELLKLVDKDRKARQILAHQNSGRSIASRKDVYLEDTFIELEVDISSLD